MKHKDDGDTDCNWYTRNNPQRLGKGTRRFTNKKTSGDDPDYSIVKKCPGDLRKLVVPQNPVRDYRWYKKQTCKEYTNNNNTFEI